MEKKIRKIEKKVCKLEEQLKRLAPNGVLAMADPITGGETLDELTYNMCRASEADTIAEYTVYRLESIEKSVRAAVRKARKMHQKTLTRLEDIKDARDEMMQEGRA